MSPSQKSSYLFRRRLYETSRLSSKNRDTVFSLEDLLKQQVSGGVKGVEEIFARNTRLREDDAERRPLDMPVGWLGQWHPRAGRVLTDH